MVDHFSLRACWPGQGRSPPGLALLFSIARFLQVLKSQTYPAKIADASYNVTIDEVHVLKKGKIGLMIGVKNGYFFLAKCNNEDAKQQGPACAASLAVGFYWAVGPDA